MNYVKVTDPNILSQLESNDNSRVTDPKILAQLNGEASEEENQFLPQKQEDLGSVLPRDILIGLSNLGHKTLNMPYDLAKNIESQGKSFGQSTDNSLPIDKYSQGNKLPGGNYLKSLVDSFNKEHNVPSEMINENWDKSFSEKIPHQENYDYAKLLGQKGTPSTTSDIIQKGIEYAPELVALGTLLRGVPITAKGIMNKLSEHKSGLMNKAKEEYGALFKEAEEKGISHVFPPESAIKNRHRINANSQSKHNRALNEYIQNPTLRNAHDAQSELRSLERHLNSIADKTGLTPSQHKTLKAVQDARKDIRQELIGENGFGAEEGFAEKYNDLTNKYREEVIPYKRLEELNEFENKTMKPKTAVDKLLKDDQFMIELSKRYPGLFLHTPKTKKALKTIGGIGGTVIGYEGIKKLLK